jgi:hypothetical protein
MFESLERENSSDSMIHRTRQSVTPWSLDWFCSVLKIREEGMVTDSIKSETKLKKHERRYRLKFEIKAG